MSMKVSTNHPTMDHWFDGGYKIGEPYLFTVNETDILGCDQVIWMLSKGRESKVQVYEARYTHLERLELADFASVIKDENPELIIINIYCDDDETFDSLTIRENMQALSREYLIPVVIVASSDDVSLRMVDSMSYVAVVADSSISYYHCAVVRCAKNREKDFNGLNPFSFNFR